MWDLILSVPDHCLSFYFSVIRLIWVFVACGEGQCDLYFIVE